MTTATASNTDQIKAAFLHTLLLLPTNGNLHLVFGYMLVDSFKLMTFLHLFLWQNYHISPNFLIYQLLFL